MSTSLVTSSSLKQPPADIFKQHHIRLGLPVCMTVTICGGGNSAHTAAAYIGSKPGLCVNVLTRQPHRWKTELLLTTETTCWEGKGDIWGLIHKVTDKPDEVIPSSDVVLIASPAHSHPCILKKIAPYMKAGATLGSIYCQGGFDWAFKSFLSTSVLSKLDGVWGLLNIPWICSSVEYGVRAKLIGPKSHLCVASLPVSKVRDFARLVELLFDIPCRTSPNFLSLTLTPSNQIIHPARYYALFKNWNGVEVYDRDFVPEGFYCDFDDESAEWLQKLDNELQTIKSQICKRFPTLDLSCDLPIAERIKQQYAGDITDTSSLKMIFRTNRGYTGTRTPVQCVGNGVQPKLDSRLFWEDVPYGLCILKSLAQMLEIETPAIDFMIQWHQKLMNKEYLLPNKTLNSLIISETGCPEAYGLFTIDEVVSSTLPSEESLTKN